MRKKKKVRIMNPENISWKEKPGRVSVRGHINCVPGGTYGQDPDRPVHAPRFGREGVAGHGIGARA